MTSPRKSALKNMLLLGVVLGVFALSLAGWRVGAKAVSSVSPRMFGATLTQAGFDLTTNDAWRTSSVAKPLDANGDNIYGSNGYALYGGTSSQPIQQPCYAAVSTSPGASIFFSPGIAPDPGAGPVTSQVPFYTALDDPAFTGTGPVANSRTGTVYRGGAPGQEHDLVVITITQASSFRLGVIQDHHDFESISPISLRLRQTAGGAADSGQFSANQDRDRDGDYYFFDVLNAVPGDVFVLSGIEIGPHGSNGIYGVTFDHLAAINCLPTPGAALHFDGVDDHLTFSSTGISTTAGTVSFWMKNEPYAINAPVFVDFGGESFAVFLWNSGNTLYFRAGGGQFPVTYSGIGQWHHIAMVWNGPGQPLYGYVDGVQVGSAIQGGGGFSGPAYVGRSSLYPPSQAAIKGAMDEFRVWNRALCQAEIQQQMNCELSGSETNLVVYYKFNQGNAGGNNAGVTTATDAAGGNNNGILNNFALSGATSNWVAPGGVTSGVSCTTNPTCNQAPNCSGATIADQIAGANCQVTISGADVLGVTDPDGDTLTFTVSPTTLQLGANSVTIMANDGKGGTCSTTVTVTVKDMTPPQITSLPPNASYQCLSEVPTGDPSQATATDNCSTATITVADASNGGLGTPASPLVITRLFIAKDAKGNQSSATQTITVIDNTPPTLGVPAPITVNNAAGQCGAAVSFNVTASDNCGTVTPSCSHASGAVFPIGTTTVSCTASDAAGNPAAASFTVTVLDAQAPTIALTGAQIALWPPNHQYETVSVAQLVAGASDNCGTNLTAGVVIAKVTSDEPEDAPGGGDGNTLNDIVVAPDCKSVQLRAERQGSGNGRVYTLTFKVKDAAGNLTTATAKVTVPKSQGNNGAAVDDGVAYTVNSNCQ